MKTANDETRLLLFLEELDQRIKAAIGRLDWNRVKSLEQLKRETGQRLAKLKTPELPL